MFLIRYPYHNGNVRFCFVPEVYCRSSIADAYLTSVASDQAVFMSARPNGMPVPTLTPAGRVIIG